MKNVFLVSHTDQWLSRDSFRTIGIASTLKNAIKLAKEDCDAVADVISGNGHIVISEFTMNEVDSDAQVFTTQTDENREKIINLRVKKFIKEFGKRVRSNESDSFVELMMDDHTCIEFEDKQYYIKEDNSMYSDIDEDIVELLHEDYHV